MVGGPGGEFDPVLSVGYKTFIDVSIGAGYDFTANAIYAPLTPDTSAPIVTIIRPLDCSVSRPVARSSPASTASTRGTAIRTRRASETSRMARPWTHRPRRTQFSVMGTDGDGKRRTRTIHYTVHGLGGRHDRPGHHDHVADRDDVSAQSVGRCELLLHGRRRTPDLRRARRERCPDRHGVGRVEVLHRQRRGQRRQYRERHGLVLRAGRIRRVPAACRQRRA